MGQDKGASKQNVSDFITVRSPLVTQLCCVFVIGCTFIIYGNAIVNNSLLKDPDVKLDWNGIFDKLGKQEYCLHDTPTKVSLTPAELKANYTSVSLTSAVQYVPTERYTMGTYHNDSTSYGKDFLFLLNATAVGIIPEVQSVGDATPAQEHKMKLQQTILVSVQFHHTYTSANKCKITKVSAGNKYAPDLTEDKEICEPDTENYACYTFYFPNQLYNDTFDLKNAQIPVAANKEQDLETCMENTFTCPPPKSLEKLKTARKMKRSENPHCSSQLYFSSTHKEDKALIKMIDQDTREMVKVRLFLSGLVLLAIVAGFIIFASFRGSTHAIKDFDYGASRAEQSTRESTRLMMD